MEELDQLERLARSGDPGALTKLGKLSLVGRAGGLSPSDGARLLAAAAEAGSAEADALISVLIGAEAKLPSDWDLALDHLGRAASRGWLPAREQLAIIARDPELAAQSKMETPPARIWRQLRDAVNILEIAKACRAELKFQSPHIKILEQFATRDECEWMIARARPNLLRAGVFDQQRGGKNYDATRTGSAMLFNILDAELILIILRARIAAATNVAVRCLEDTNVLHYATGQEFKRHCDYLDPRQPGLEREISENGQRGFTFLIYLNNGFDGGETEFARLGWRFKGHPGDALLFRNVTANGAPDPQTLHAGCAPVTGEKWLLSQWIRTHPPQRSS
jgi:hypothetical protein